MGHARAWLVLYHLLLNDLAIPDVTRHAYEDAAYRLLGLRDVYRPWCYLSSQISFINENLSLCSYLNGPSPLLRFDFHDAYGRTRVDGQLEALL